MAAVTVNLTGVDAQPSVRVLTMSDGDGRRFASLDLGKDATVILPGFDLAASDYMRKAAKVLSEAATRIELQLTETLGV